MNLHVPQGRRWKSEWSIEQGGFEPCFLLLYAPQGRHLSSLAYLLFHLIVEPCSSGFLPSEPPPGARFQATHRLEPDPDR